MMYQQPPQPPIPPPQGMPPGYQQQRMQADLNRNYTPAAWLSALLSLLFVVPGVIATIIYLVEATNVRKRTGVTPQGYGCLWAVLIWCAVPFVIVLFFFFTFLFSAGWAGWH